MNKHTLKVLRAVSANLCTEAVVLGPTRGKVAERLRSLSAMMDAALDREEEDNRVILHMPPSTHEADL